MKKSLLLCSLALAAACNLFAQDTTAKPGTLKNPLPLNIGGENKYEYAGGYSTPIWKYTAAEDQMVTISPVSNVSSVDVTINGSTYPSSNKRPSVKYGTDYLFVIQKDATLFLNVTGYSSPIAFEASAKSHPYKLGASCEDAIELTADGNAMFIPFREENYLSVPVYMKYTATEDGALEITALGFVNEAAYAEGATGEFIGISCKQDPDNKTDYRTFFPIEKGKEYFLRMSSNNARMLTAKVTHPTYGESDLYPVIITGTDAEIPAKAGTYYYEVTGTESGFVMISSDVTDFDGSVTYGSLINSTRYTINDGSFDLRQTATKGGHYSIVVKKNSDTAEPQKFQVRFETRQPYDDFDKSATITLGSEVKLPPYPATYYYRVAVPAEGAYILKAAPAKAFTDKNSSISLYRTSNSSTALYIGDPDIYCEVEAGNEYIIKVIASEADKRNSFVADIQELKQGDGASNPFIVKIGENALDTGDSKYFLYKAEKNSWVVITPADNTINAPVVKRLKSELASYEQNVTILRHGDSHRFEAEKGHSYLIRFTKIKEATKFDFALPDYAQGESRDNPFKAEGSSITIPAAPGTYWWTYTPERNGKLHISTDFKYDIITSPTRENAVKLLDDAGTVLTALPINYTDEVFNATAYNVDEGKNYFIQIISVTEQTDKTVTLEITDLDPGETPAVAIEIKPTEVPYSCNIAKNNGGFTSGTWYAIDLQEGELSMYSKASVNFYFYEENENKVYDRNNVKYSSGIMWDANYTTRTYGISKKSITKPGRHYFIIYYTYADAEMIFEGSAVKASTSGIEETVEIADQAFSVAGNMISAMSDIQIFDLAGRKVMDVKAGNYATLSHGIYVVKSDASVAKVSIR